MLCISDLCFCISTWILQTVVDSGNCTCTLYTFVIAFPEGEWNCSISDLKYGQQQEMFFFSTICTRANRHQKLQDFFSFTYG